MRKQSAVDRGRNKPRSVSVSASWRSVATLFSRPTKPLRFTPLASNHRSTDTGSVGPASIANTIASTTDSRGAPCSALRLWNSHNYRVLCLQVQIFVGKDGPNTAYVVKSRKRPTHRKLYLWVNLKVDVLASRSRLQETQPNASCRVQ